MKICGILLDEKTHKCHKEFLKSVADEVHFMNVGFHRDGGQHLISRLKPLLTPPRCTESNDIVIFESLIESMWASKKIWNKKFKGIELMASPGIIKMLEGEKGGIGKRIGMAFANAADGFMVVSELYKDLLKKHGINKPIVVTPPYIPETRYNKLLGNAYNTESKVICGIGSPWHYKGLDFTLKVFDRIAESDEECRLILLTNEKENMLLREIKNRDKILITSTYDDELFTKVMSLVGAYLHFGRYEGFGLSVVEAMLGGIPAFVSKLTGAKQAVAGLGKDHILDFDEESAAESVLKYFEKPRSKKERISKKAREIAKDYEKKNMIENFRKKFSYLLSEIK